MSTIGERLREEREKFDLNQTVFGAVGGIRKQAQLNYEKGERYPAADYLSAISKIGVDVQYIVTGIRSVETLMTEELELINYWRSAPLAGKLAAIAALKAGQDLDGKSAVSHYTQTILGSVENAAGRDITVNNKRTKQ